MAYIKNAALHTISNALQPIVFLGKLVVSEEVILQLIEGKCMPILLYGLETCPLKNRILDHWILS